jgi:hypothetical protein
MNPESFLKKAALSGFLIALLLVVAAVGKLVQFLIYGNT